MTFDDVIKQVGAFGPYQRRLILLGLFPYLIFAFQFMIPIFILSEHKHRCKDKQTAYPEDNIWVSNASLTSCQTHHFDNVTNTTYDVQCKSWSYDTSEQTSSPISDFDLVCDNAVAKSHVTMAFSFGMLVGALLSGIFGDSFGRKPVVCITLTFLCFSIGCAWAPSAYVLAILRFLTGVGCNLGPLKLIVMEMVGPTWRYFVVSVHEITFTIGEMILCCLAYFVRDWRTLQLTGSVPSVFGLLYVLHIS
ncbi:organic cation transporter protein-like [Mizuhopecten yessoensis]|uniref:organic cation transporter protein-like n=1 Tax=Mizuhopecten yessoensis TaxID=6573 RepID=UPI000B45A5D5|nr:organic cation transporter protein-like [Mizuhopecten yessoensis]